MFFNINIQKAQNISLTAVLLIIVFSSITNLFTFLNGVIQPAEVIFCLGLPFLCISLFTNHFNKTQLDFVVIFYLIITTINYAYHYGNIDFPEYLGTLYLAAIFFVISRVLSIQDNISAILTKSMIGLWLVTIASGIIGYLVFKFEYSSRFVVVYEDYPYLGTVVRWCGFTWCTVYVGCLVMSSFFTKLLNC